MSIWRISQKLKIAGLFFLISTSAHAVDLDTCDCWPVSSTAEAVKGATQVFEAEILQLKRFAIEKIGKDYKEFAVRLRIVRVWKGPVSDYLIVRTPAEKSNCGVKFEPGQTWVIYTIGGPIPLVTKCSRSSLSTSATAENDKEFLGPGQEP